jgi:hypothetical protein
MKRIILIVTIALLPVLSACFAGIRPHCNCPTTTVLEPVVSDLGTLTNLKLEYDKGKRLFKKPIQEGFYVRYRIGNGETKAFYAIGDRVSDPNVSYSGYQEEITGAGITSEDGLNVTSVFFFDRRFGTVSVTRTFVNRLEDKTMYLSEIKNYGDAILRPLSTVVGTPNNVVEFPPATGEAKQVKSLHTKIDKNVAQKWTRNCWPCDPSTGCTFTTMAQDPMKATIVCVSCNKDVPSYVHTVCLANLEEELANYKANGCDYSVTFTGISDTRAQFESACPKIVEPVEARYTPGAAPLETGRAPSEGTLGRLLTSRRTEPGQGPSEEILVNMLTLPPKAAVVVRTVHKINTSWK